MTSERFEVRLTAEEAQRVREDMRLLGKSKRADYLRDCLLAGAAGRAEELSHGLGSLALAVNELLEAAATRAASSTPGEPSRTTGQLAARLVRLVKQVQVQLNLEER